MVSNGAQPTFYVLYIPHKSSFDAGVPPVVPHPTFSMNTQSLITFITAS